MEIPCCPLPTFRMGRWETEAVLAPIAAYYTPYRLHVGWTGLVVPSAVYLPAGELWPASRSPPEGDGGATGGLRPRL